jgi:glycosyltransferase involved in cell wall biosynthesis
MKILLDARFFEGKHNGISNDAQSILEILESQGHELHFLVYRNQNTDIIKKFLNSNNVINAETYSFELLKSIFRMTIDCSRIEVDLFFQFQVTPIRVKVKSKTKQILRVHDLFPLTNPEWFSRRSRFLFKLGLENLNKFDLLLANSRTTANSLKQLNNNSVSSIDVLQCFVRPAVNEILCGNCSFCMNPVDTKGVFFAIGTFEPRKNYRMLVDAFVSGTNDSCKRLVIVGGKGWGNLNLPEFRDKSISFFEEVCEGTIGLLYRDGETFISVSLQEGFNIPLMAALEKGKKIIASDLPIHRELAKDYNICWIDPENMKSIASAFRSIDSKILCLPPQINHRNYTQEINKILSKLENLDS